MYSGNQKKILSQWSCVIEMRSFRSGLDHLSRLISSSSHETLISIWLPLRRPRIVYKRSFPLLRSSSTFISLLKRSSSFDNLSSSHISMPISEFFFIFDVQNNSKNVGRVVFHRVPVRNSLLPFTYMTINGSQGLRWSKTKSQKCPFSCALAITFSKEIRNRPYFSTWCSCDNYHFTLLFW